VVLLHKKDLLESTSALRAAGNKGGERGRLAVMKKFEASKQAKAILSGAKLEEFLQGA